MSPFEAFQNRRNFASLDGMRCLCILAVVVSHAHGPLDLGWLNTHGALGVDMFFVLSGFLIATLLLRERDRTGTVSLRDFYARRALRIMPLYYAVLVAGAALSATVLARAPEVRGYFADLPFAATYLSNWRREWSLLGVTWSLSAEEQFYLVWPAIQKHARRPVTIVVGLIAASQALRLGVVGRVLAPWLGLAPQLPSMLLYTTFTPILLGVLLAHVLHTQPGFERAWALFGRRFVAVGWTLALLLLPGLLPGDRFGASRLAVLVTMTFLVGSLVVRADHALAPILDCVLLRRVGVVSYGIYLLHLFVAAWAGRMVATHRLPARWLLPEVLALSYVLAEISYRFYETPFLRLKQRFSPRQGSMSLAEAQPVVATDWLNV